jgi:hypothetical protein
MKYLRSKAPALAGLLFVVVLIAILILWAKAQKIGPHKHGFGAPLAHALRM